MHVNCCSSVGEASIVQVFDHLFNSLLALIPNPPDPESLMGKNVVLGKRVLNDIKFKLVSLLTKDPCDGAHRPLLRCYLTTTNGFLSTFYRREFL